MENVRSGFEGKVYIKDDGTIVTKNEWYKLDVELSSKEIFNQPTYKSTLGTDARKSRLRGKATTMYDKVKVNLSVEVKKSAYALKKSNNRTEQDIRMQAQKNGLTKNELRKLNKKRKSAK